MRGRRFSKKDDTEVMCELGVHGYGGHIRGSIIDQKKAEVYMGEQLAEKFAPEPEVEDRDISEDELDALLEGFDQPEPEDDGKKYKVVIQGDKK